jgi:hypothetical protein
MFFHSPVSLVQYFSHLLLTHTMEQILLSSWLVYALDYWLISVQTLAEGVVTFLAGMQNKLWSKILQDPHFSFELINFFPFNFFHHTICMSKYSTF